MADLMKRSRILAAATAALLLTPAAPAVARTCVNIGQGPNAYTYASSTHASGLYPASGINNGVLESGASKGYWNDDTNGIWPDWVAVGFLQPLPQRVTRIVAKIPTIQPGFPVGETTLRRTRVQYLDRETGWTDVVGVAGQDNPIVDWSGPLVADGSETRTFDLATPVNTTAVRVVFDEGSSDGWSWLAELETWDCLPNLATARYGGTAFTSSNASFSSASFLNDDYVAGDWMDGTPGLFPDDAGIEWRTARTLDRIVLRAPLWRSSMTPAERVLRQTRIQYWDAGSSTWSDVVVTGTGQRNPLVDWFLPQAASSLQDVSAQFDFAPVTTTRIRALFEAGTDYGDSVLEEIQAFEVS